MSNISVFTFFAHLDKDVYIISLYNALAKLGVTAHDIRTPKKLFTSKIIHLHWLEYYVVSKSRFKSTLKLIFMPLLFFTLRYILRKKIIISLHNIESHEKYHPRIERIGFKIFLSYIANRIIFFSDWQREELKKRYHIKEKKIRRTDLVSFINKYKQTMTKKEARKKLGIKEDKFVLLMFGRLDEYKGVYDVINFLEKNPKRNYAVLFAGKPENEDIKEKILALKKKQKETIFLYDGYFSDEDIQMYMNASDAGLLAQKWLTNSGVLLLFGAFKKPIIAKESVAFKETLGKEGMFYKNDTELKKLIENLNQKKAAQKGKNFYEDIKDITWEKISKETLAIYKETLNN